MMRKIVSIVIIVFIISSCSRDWNIADSGLDNDSPVPSVSDPQINNYGNAFEDSGNEASQESSSDGYDPDAAPPKILDSVMGSAWREFTNAPIQNNPGNRSADAYLAVLLQFNVANSYQCRYTPSCGGTSDTRCNIYASDVMNAMGVPLPTKGDLGVGQGDSKYTDPMPANAKDTYGWLQNEEDGWKKLDPNNSADWSLLMVHIAAGMPALVSHPDHIAVLRPDQPSDLAVGDVDGLHIAQAGAYNSNDTLVQSAFGNRTVEIFIHQ